MLHEFFFKDYGIFFNRCLYLTKNDRKFFFFLRKKTFIEKDQSAAKSA